MNKSRIYIIGDRETGVLMVKSNPVKVVSISREAIEAYAADQQTSFDDIFGRIAKAGSQIVNVSQDNPPKPDFEQVYEAVGMNVLVGQTVSDADFCFIADIDDDKYDFNRFRVVPIKTALEALSEPWTDTTGGFAQVNLN